MAGGRPRRVRLTNQPRGSQSDMSFPFWGEVHVQCCERACAFTQRHNNLCPTVHVHTTTMLHGI